MFARLCRIAAAVTLIALPIAASGQRLSDSYEFLKAVRAADGDKVTKMLDTPGSRIIDSRDRLNGEAALHIVARRGDTLYLRFFIAREANLNVQDGRGETALMIVAGGGCSECLDLLIKAGANVNLANSSGETPLIRAVQFRNVDFARRLLEAGANPDQADRIAGRSARDYAMNDGRSPALAKLLSDAPKRQARAVAGPRL